MDNIKDIYARFDQKCTDYQIAVLKMIEDQRKEIKSLKDYIMNSVTGQNARFGDVANALKGSASGKGTLSLTDVSPLAHKIKIAAGVKFIQNIAELANGSFAACYAAAFKKIKPNVTYTLSFENSTGEFVDFDSFAIYTYTSNDGNSSTYFHGKLSQTESGRLYCTFTTDENCLLGMSHNPPDDPNAIMVENFCLVEGTSHEYLPKDKPIYTPQEMPDPVNIMISTDVEVKAIRFTEAGTKEVETRTTDGAVTITPDNADINIEVEYNRDINKAIT